MKGFLQCGQTTSRASWAASPMRASVPASTACAAEVQRPRTGVRGRLTQSGDADSCGCSGRRRARRVRSVPTHPATGRFALQAVPFAGRGRGRAGGCVLDPRDRQPDPDEDALRSRPLPAGRTSQPPPRLRARRRDDRDRAPARCDQHLGDLPDERDRAAGDAGPPQRAVRAPPANVVALLHLDANRGDPVPDRERRRRRPARRHRDVRVGAFERGDPGRVARRDAVSLVAADAPVGRRPAGLRPDDPPCRTHAAATRS